jgi:uncharacterized protein (UPF0305 family)
MPIAVSRNVELPPNYDRITIKESHRVHNVKLIYQEKQWNGKEYVEQFNIYEVQISAGANPKVVFLFTNPKILLHKGIQFLRMAPIDSKPNVTFSDESIINKMVAKLRVKSKKPINSWDDLFQIHLSQINSNPLFFKLQPPLDDTEIQEIKQWDFSQLEKDYFYEGMQKDDTMVYIFRPQVISFGIDPYQHEDTCSRVQPYNSHTLSITPTKYGKTWMGKKIGKHYTDATSSRLIGFATAETVAEGDLNGEYKAHILDNVHLYSPKILKHLLELQQTGETTTGKGKETTVTRSTAPLTYIANPPEVEDPVVLAQSFEQVINLFVISGAGAVGSRFAQVYFTTETKERKGARGNPLPPEIVKKNKLVFEHIINEVNKEATYKIFPDKRVQEWLNQEIVGVHQIAQQFISGAQPFLKQQVAEFWVTYFREAYRFIRGTALKHAIMDNLKQVYLKSYSIDDLLQDADTNVNKIVNIAMESLQKLLKIVGTKPYEEWVYSKYQSITTEKAKAVVLAVLAYIKKNPIPPRGTMFPIYHLEQPYNELDQKVKPQGYGYFSNVLAMLPKKFNKFNNELGDFGFQLYRLDNPSVINIYFTKDGKELSVLTQKILP